MFRRRATRFRIELKYRLWRSSATLAEVPIVFQARRGGEVEALEPHLVREGVLHSLASAVFFADPELDVPSIHEITIT